MSNIDDGGMVYPLAGDADYEDSYRNGITRRDWLAGMAMQGAMDAWIRQEVDDYYMENVAQDAYRMADAMIAESRKEAK